ncbi:Transmembrane amino acid transporter family protein [Zea mays]|uniref:Transmembrane amino acid transporter family protein n=1 Tax=Zea mays TaxID=4577 RepID=A0A1D6NDR1_MAIZE|nr:Transmembrane amino acid transporter family protein [Zea mays]
MARKSWKASETQNSGTALNAPGIPIAIGLYLYGYCYSGHGVFPNIYSSLKIRNQFPSILFTCTHICFLFLVSIGLSTFLYAGAAVTGYKMFGEATESQFTLNLPDNSVISKIAVWTTTYILPCACFLAILKTKVGWHQIAACSFIIVVGVCCAYVGTYSSLSKIIQNYA